MPNMWRLKTVPTICERVIAFSIPKNNQIFVVSYEGTHLIKLENTIRVEHDHTLSEYDVYDPDTGIAHYRNTNYEMIGLHGGRPLTINLENETLELDSAAQTLTITHNDKVCFQIPYANSSGDWEFTTFSPDGAWIIFGCPYGMDFMILQRL